MQREDHGLRCVSPHLGQLAFQAFAGPSEPSKRILDSNRPVGAGDYQTLLAGASIEARLTQAESAFDDIGNVLGDPCLPLIFECLFGPAGGHEARLEMLSADDAQMLWRDWRRLALHGLEQLANSNSIDPVFSEKAAQRESRDAGFGEDRFLLLRAAQAAKFGDELTHRPVLPE